MFIKSIVLTLLDNSHITLSKCHTQKKVAIPKDLVTVVCRLRRKQHLHDLEAHESSVSSERLYLEPKC